MNDGTSNDNPQENTVPHWLLPTHAEPKDVIVTPDLDPTFFVLGVTISK